MFLLFIVFAICLGFYLFGFFSSFFLFSLAALCRLLIPQPERGQAWATGGGVTSPGHWAARERLDPGNINWCAHSWRYSSQYQELAPPNWLQAPMLDISYQTTSKIGIQPHSSAHRLPKVILSSQTPQNTRSDTALPIRRKTQLYPPEHRHQSLSPEILHKPLDQIHLPGDGQQKQEEP